MNDTTTFPSGSNASASVVDRVAEKAHEAVDTVANKAKPAVNKVQSLAEGTVDSVKSKVDSITDLRDQWLGTARSQIREQPLTAVAIGLLAGVIVSRLSR